MSIVLIAALSLAISSCADQGNQNSNQAAGNANANSSPVTMPPLPPGFPTPVINGNIPILVPVPSSVTTPEQARPFFDYFSWETFIALNWPAQSGNRGQPNQPTTPSVFLKAGNGYSSVWETYRNALDLFESGNQRPPEWNAPGTSSLCPSAPAGASVLEMFAKGSAVGDNIDESFSFPLIDQFKNYAVFEIRFNETQYNFIRGDDNNQSTWLYLLKNLLNPIQMPASGPPNIEGATMLKAAWRVMTDSDDLNRYYVIDAQVYDPQTKSCVQQKVGLVGFHIVRKLKDFPEWIWSTFEQVDNVQRGPGATPTTPISFNNGTNNPQTVNGYFNKPANKFPNLVSDQSQRVPVQVTRLNPIPTTPAGSSTVDINKIYQQLLAGTVWQYYELVFTQWPSQPQSFKLIENGGIYPQDSGSAFPVNGVTNTTMETYFQSQSDAAGAGGNSCMSCHYRADSTDFSWAVKRRAH